MLSNLGYTIQKIINNMPTSVTLNDTSSAVVTSGGNVYQSGLIGGKTQFSFRDILASEIIDGQIIDAQLTNEALYLLSDKGSVYEYNYRSSDCNIGLREVYSVTGCGGGDKAVKIVAGSNHLVILTAGHRVWGVGSNDQYQIVPQGASKYYIATEIIVTDTNVHDNQSANSFVGIVSELESPIIPKIKRECNKFTCLKEEKCDVVVGYLSISNVNISNTPCPGVLQIPICGDFSYSGYLCVDEQGCAAGSVTYLITRLYIQCGHLLANFVYNDSAGCNKREINVSSTTEIVIFEAQVCPPIAKTDLCSQIQGMEPISKAVAINGQCDTCAIINLDLPDKLPLPGAAFDFDCKTILLELNNCRSSVTILCEGAFTNLAENNNIEADLSVRVPLECCQPCAPSCEVTLPQPCWTDVDAQGSQTALLDNCNNIYEFGSIYKIRSNYNLINRNCLQDILQQTNASISFPADQINCAPHKAKNNNCPCPECRDKPFKTDFSKFGVHVSFPPGNGDCGSKTMSICDFINSLKSCNDSAPCEPTCTPCDGYIYLSVTGPCGAAYGAPSAPAIGSITLLNSKSVCKLISQNRGDITTIGADLNTFVEFDLNKYCVNSVEISLDKVLRLEFCEDGPNVNLYLDVSQPGGIKFVGDNGKCNVEFSVTASSPDHQYILNYGPIMESRDLTNLKYALSLDPFYSCPRYRNPPNTKITNTYLRGGDVVKFLTTNPKNIRQAITPDLPTVFRIGRRVIDMTLGGNNITVVVGGLACPNEVLTLGFNCYGELGLGNNVTTLVWRQLNRCQFDCQVVSVFAGDHVTFYVTRSQQVYAAGQWKCFINSSIPAPVESFCRSWKIKQIAVGTNNIIVLGADGCIFGLGDNGTGELGLCNFDCVTKPTPLVFFYRLNSCVGKQLSEGLSNPLEKTYRKNCTPYQQPQYGFCPPCPPCPPMGPACPPTGPSYGPIGQNWGGYPGGNGSCGKPRNYAPNNRLYNRK